MAGQLELRPEAVLAAAAVGSLVVAVRREHQGGVRVVARVEEIAQIVLQGIGVAELVAEPAQEARVEAAGCVVGTANVAGVEVAQQGREHGHLDVVAAQLQADAGAVACGYRFFFGKDEKTLFDLLLGELLGKTGLRLIRYRDPDGMNSGDAYFEFSGFS